MIWSCNKTDCIHQHLFNKGNCGFKVKPEFDSTGCVEYQKKEYKCYNTGCSGFSSEHKWNCTTNLSEETIKNCWNFTPEKGERVAFCARKDCIYIFELDGSCNFINGPEYDSKGCIFYKKKEYRCNTTICIHYSMEIDDCDFVSIPKKINGVCSRYEPEPIKESTCPHCGKSLSDNSIEIARRIHNELRKSLYFIPDNAIERIDKMAENYEEAIIDAVEDERERIIKIIEDTCRLMNKQTIMDDDPRSLTWNDISIRFIIAIKGKEKIK